MEKYSMFDLPFNPKPGTIMHIDINSCFATIEQQANPKLRGKPVAVAAYATDNGCILAPSVEAKRYKIKTGMRVKDAKKLYPGLIVLPPDPWKYRNVHLSLRKLVRSYTDIFRPKSIDEFVLDLEGMPSFSKGMLAVGSEIQKRVKKDIGDFMMVSIGVAPNRFLAKTAAGLQKPNGLNEINKDNFLEVYSKLKITDLTGIAYGNAGRLAVSGIGSVLDMYNADPRGLRHGFRSVIGHDWYLRLRGWEADNVDFARKSYGNSYALPKPLSTPKELAPILQKLVEKMGFRLRKAGFRATGIHLSISYRDRNYWQHGQNLRKVIFSSRDIFKEAFRMLQSSPYLGIPVAKLAVSCFNLVSDDSCQLELFQNVVKKEQLSKALDDINLRWGNFVVTPARMIGTETQAPDRIAFGGVKELEEFTIEA